MNLQDAIAQNGEIQTQLERTQTFRGYRSVAVGTTGLLATVGSVVQSLWLVNPANAVNKWLALWITIAAASVVIAGWELMQRVCNKDSPFQARASKSALKHFVPCLVGGVAVTWAIMTSAPQAAWVLPGIWSVLFSMGVFASLTILPRGGFAIALHFLLSGVVCLKFGYGDNAFAPWTMFITFGVGQLIAASVLYFALERPLQQEVQDD